MRSLIRPAVIVLAVGVLVLGACGQDDGGGDTTASGPALPARTVEAGEVTVELAPVRIDETGAEFEVTFDTHSVELGLDVARAARLSVGGADWGRPTWSGGGPGGHHREGRLRFKRGGDPSGTARLNIVGLPAPVTATWTLEGT